MRIDYKFVRLLLDCPLNITTFFSVLLLKDWSNNSHLCRLRFTKVDRSTLVSWFSTVDAMVFQDKSSVRACLIFTEVLLISLHFVASSKSSHLTSVFSLQSRPDWRLNIR